MNISLFNTIRISIRFGEQKNIKGYLVSEHHDFGASLNVHPLSTDQMQALRKVSGK